MSSLPQKPPDDSSAPQSQQFQLNHGQQQHRAAIDVQQRALHQQSCIDPSTIAFPTIQPHHTNVSGQPPTQLQSPVQFMSPTLQQFQLQNQPLPQSSIPMASPATNSVNPSSAKTAKDSTSGSTSLSTSSSNFSNSIEVEDAISRALYDIEYNNMTIRGAGRLYSVPESTLRKRRKFRANMTSQTGADNHLSSLNSGSGSGTLGGSSRSSKTTEYEEALLARLFFAHELLDIRIPARLHADWINAFLRSKKIEKRSVDAAWVQSFSKRCDMKRPKRKTSCSSSTPADIPLSPASISSSSAFAFGVAGTAAHIFYRFCDPYSPQTFESWFSTVEHYINTLKLDPKNIYAMDELAIKAPYSDNSQPHRTPIKLIEGNEAFVTLVDTVSMDGRALAPYYTYQTSLAPPDGLDLNAVVPQQGPTSTSSSTNNSNNKISVFPTASGWPTDRSIEDWFSNHFLPLTNPQVVRGDVDSEMISTSGDGSQSDNPSRTGFKSTPEDPPEIKHFSSTRALVLDTHVSHYSQRFMELAYQNDVILFFLPAETSRVLHPLSNHTVYGSLLKTLTSQVKTMLSKGTFNSPIQNTFSSQQHKDASYFDQTGPLKNFHVSKNDSVEKEHETKTNSNQDFNSFPHVTTTFQTTPKGKAEPSNKQNEDFAELRQNAFKITTLIQTLTAARETAYTSSAVTTAWKLVGLSPIDRTVVQRYMLDHTKAFGRKNIIPNSHTSSTGFPSSLFGFGPNPAEIQTVLGGEKSRSRSGSGSTTTAPNGHFLSYFNTTNSKLASSPQVESPGSLNIFGVSSSTNFNYGGSKIEGLSPAETIYFADLGLVLTKACEYEAPNNRLYLDIPYVDFFNEPNFSDSTKSNIDDCSSDLSFPSTPTNDQFKSTLSQLGPKLNEIVSVLKETVSEVVSYDNRYRNMVYTLIGKSKLPFEDSHMIAKDLADKEKVAENLVMGVKEAQDVVEKVSSWLKSAVGDSGNLLESIESSGNFSSRPESTIFSQIKEENKNNGMDTYDKDVDVNMDTDQEKSKENSDGKAEGKKVARKRSLKKSKSDKKVPEGLSMSTFGGVSKNSGPEYASSNSSSTANLSATSSNSGAGTDLSSKRRKSRPPLVLPNFPPPPGSFFNNLGPSSSISNASLFSSVSTPSGSVTSGNIALSSNSSYITASTIQSPSSLAHPPSNILTSAIQSPVTPFGQDQVRSQVDLPSSLSTSQALNFTTSGIQSNFDNSNIANLSNFTGFSNTTSIDTISNHLNTLTNPGISSVPSVSAVSSPNSQPLNSFASTSSSSAGQAQRGQQNILQAFQVFSPSSQTTVSANFSQQIQQSLPHSSTSSLKQVNSQAANQQPNENTSQTLNGNASSQTLHDLSMMVMQSQEQNNLSQQPQQQTQSTITSSAYLQSSTPQNQSSINLKSMNDQAMQDQNNNQLLQSFQPAISSQASQPVPSTSSLDLDVDMIDQPSLQPAHSLAFSQMTSPGSNAMIDSTATLTLQPRNSNRNLPVIITSMPSTIPTTPNILSPSNTTVHNSVSTPDTGSILSPLGNQPISSLDVQTPKGLQPQLPIQSQQQQNSQTDQSLSLQAQQLNSQQNVKQQSSQSEQAPQYVLYYNPNSLFNGIQLQAQPLQVQMPNVPSQQQQQFQTTSNSASVSHNTHPVSSSMGNVSLMAYEHNISTVQPSITNAVSASVSATAMAALGNSNNTQPNLTGISNMNGNSAVNSSTGLNDQNISDSQTMFSSYPLNFQNMIQNSMTQDQVNPQQQSQEQQHLVQSQETSVFQHQSSSQNLHGIQLSHDFSSYNPLTAEQMQQAHQQLQQQSLQTQVQQLQQPQQAQVQQLQQPHENQQAHISQQPQNTSLQQNFQQIQSQLEPMSGQMTSEIPMSTELSSALQQQMSEIQYHSVHQQQQAPEWLSALNSNVTPSISTSNDGKSNNRDHSNSSTNNNGTNTTNSGTILKDGNSNGELLASSVSNPNIVGTV